MRRAQNKHTPNLAALANAANVVKESEQESYHTKSICRQHNDGASTLIPPPPPPQCGGPTRHNEYAYVKENWASLPHSAGHHQVGIGNNTTPIRYGQSIGNIADMSTDSEEETIAYRGHIYESPKTMRKSYGHQPHGNNTHQNVTQPPPHYFELETTRGGQNGPPCYTRDVSNAIITNANAAVLVDFNRL